MSGYTIAGLWCFFAVLIICTFAAASALERRRGKR